MAEIVALASAVISLGNVTYNSCKVLLDTISGIKNAPKHIHVLLNDLEDLCLVLDTLQALFNDDEFSVGSSPSDPRSATFHNLATVLKNCLTIFGDIQAIVQNYRSQGTLIDLGIWKNFKWTFKEKEMEGYRRDLVNHKMTLNIAISVANMYNVASSSARIEADVTEVRKQLPAILKEIEEVKEKQLPVARTHSEIERAGLRVDHKFALRHYLDSAASFMSEAGTPVTPSIQVSAFHPSSSDKSSGYRTAPTFLASESNRASIVEHCIQLFIKTPIDTKTLVIRLSPSDIIERIKAIVRGKINLHDAQFKLALAGRVLDDCLTLQDHDIPQDSTLTCVSFRPKPMLSLTVTSFDNESRSCGSYEINIDAVEPKDVVVYIKERLCGVSGVPLDRMRLIYAGQPLEERSQIIGDAFHQFDRHIQMYSEAPPQPSALASPPQPKPSEPPQQLAVWSGVKRSFSSKWRAVPLLPPKRRYYGHMVQR
ncbi:Ubiquitin [Lobaria immixta]|nr:Ubiquitin [Lobaria immixta]